MTRPWRPPPDGPFTYQLRGQRYATVTPEALSDGKFMHALTSPAAFAVHVLNWPKIPLPRWAMTRLHDAWIEHFDLPTPAEAQRMCALMFRYGNAIEYDLRDVDVAQLWAGRRWRRLLNLIDRLPVSSQFVEAQANDEEFARVAVQMHHGDDDPQTPRLSEWDPIRAELAVVADRLGEVVSVLIAANGGAAVQIPPRPRPVTAFDRARDDWRKHRHLALVARVLPPEEREEA